MGCESTKAKRYDTNSKSLTKTDTKTVRRQLTKGNQIETITKGKTFYVKQKAEILTNDEIGACKQQVELFISLDNVKGEETELKAILYINNNAKKSNDYYKILETKYGYGDQISFETTAITDYFFEKEQKIKIDIYDHDENIIESHELTMGRIMGSPKNIYKIKLDNFDINIEAKNASGFDVIDEFKVRIQGQKGKSEYFKNIFFLISNYNDGKNYRKIYKSEEIESMLNGCFEKFSLDGNSINNGKDDQNILFEVHDLDKGPIGYAETSINALKTSSIVKLKNESLELTGDSLIIEIKQITNHNFIDLLKMGLSINLYIGIDYTASNGDPSNPSSLHYIQGLEPNPYERAIRNCGSIVAHYDDDQKFPVFGFGGIPPGNTVPSFCFNVSFNNDFEIQGIDNVVQAYKNSLSVVRLYGPTNFSPLISTVNQYVKEALKVNIWSYAILMIITDGMISDMDETINQIVESSYLPISIIIIGVGKSDFYNMNILDADEEPLKGVNDKVQQRDNVQFVEFLKYEGNYDKLTEEVLEEVPLQVQQYYQHHDEAIQQYKMIGNNNNNINNNLNKQSTMNMYSNFNPYDEINQGNKGGFQGYQTQRNVNNAYNSNNNLIGNNQEMNYPITSRDINLESRTVAQTLTPDLPDKPPGI